MEEDFSSSRVCICNSCAHVAYDVDSTRKMLDVFKNILDIQKK